MKFIEADPPPMSTADQSDYVQVNPLYKSWWRNDQLDYVQEVP